MVVVQTTVDNVVGPWVREWLDLFAAALKLRDGFSQ